MSSYASVAKPAAAPRVSLRPIALPNEHGGWGFLFEPLVLGLAVAPSLAGALIAVASIFGFLTRQPLKFAMQDALRHKTYPRTKACWLIASIYASGAVAAVSAAVIVSSWRLLVPFAIVAPLAAVALVADARNQSRNLVPELAGAIAMTSSAAAIAVAAAQPWIFVVLLVACNVSAIVYVRALFKRAHPAWPIVLHIAGVAAALFFGWLAVVAMLILLVRAIAGLASEVPRAKTIGWREIAFGAMSVTLFALSLRL